MIVFGSAFSRSSRSRNWRQGGGLRKIADGIKTRVRAELFHQTGVVVAQGAEMKLLGPAFFSVQPPEEQHHEGGKLRVFGRVKFLFPRVPWQKFAAAVFSEQKSDGTVGQAVVGKPAALRVEIIVAGAQRVEKFPKRYRSPRRRPRPDGPPSD